MCVYRRCVNNGRKERIMKDTLEEKLERYLNPKCAADFELIKTVEQVKLATGGRTMFDPLIRREAKKAKESINTEELKPCPFCGAEARINNDDCCVECTGCTAMTYCQDTVQPAVEQWNRRTPE